MRTFPNELAIFKKLDTPQKVQDLLDTFRINFEPNDDTCRSPLVVLERREAHCIEGALLAAAIFWFHGREPLLLDLKTAKGDFDHVVALFKEHGRWGAVSKTNHAVLRYRDPVYKDIRELAMSYFNEYFLDTGVKTLRSFSDKPFDLLKFDDAWLTSRKNLWEIHDALDSAPHTQILPRGFSPKKLRLADPIEIKAGKIVEWKRGRKGKV